MIAYRPRRTSSRRHTALGCALMGALALCNTATSVSAQCMYEITAIVEPPNPCGSIPPAIVPTAINDQGVVCGYIIGCFFTDERPFTWSEETGLVILDLPEGVTDARAEDINNHGDIVGTMNVFAPSADQAYVIKDGVWTTLPQLDGLPQARAHAINDNGVVVGESLNIITGPTLACIWQGGSVAQIELPIGPNSVAFDINASSTITGRMGGSGTRFVTYVSINDVVIEIPELPNASRSDGLAVNSLSTVTGQTFIKVKSGSVPRRSWVFENGLLTDLSALPGMEHRVIASDINDSVQIVGLSSSTNSVTAAPFLWQHGDIFNLRELVYELPEDLFLRQSAAAINNRGQIVVPANGSTKMVVLTPADRPIGDVNIDCAVDANDIADVLRDWGPCPERGSCLCDIVDSATFQPPGDGVVDGADLAVVLGNWTKR